MPTTPEPAELLAEHDAIMREGGPPPAGWQAEWDGPVLRHWCGTDAFVVFSRLTPENADAAVAAQRDWARDRGLTLEWKLYGHDGPADLPARLVAAGYVPEPTETLLVASVADLAERLAGTGPPPGVHLREVAGRAELARMAELNEAVWGEPVQDWSDALVAEKEADPASMRFVFAEAADGTLVCSARLQLHTHTAEPGSGPRFGSLWGGGTRPGWRGKGVYKSTVARRVDWAVEARCRWLVVDASSDSRPILQRLGFVSLTTTTPYMIGA